MSAERHGIPALNRYAAVARAVDKARMAASLASAGIPTPPTWLGSPQRLAAELPSQLYPVILKPIQGDNCRGLEVSTSPGAVARSALESEELLLAQPYLSGDGSDLSSIDSPRRGDRRPLRSCRRPACPRPDTYVAARAGELAPLLDDGPLVVKPNRGRMASASKDDPRSRGPTHGPTRGP